MRTIRLALAQINPTVGDFENNVKKVEHFTKLAIQQECDIVAFPEMCLTGYPPEDLLLKPEFIDDNLKYLEKLLPLSKDITMIVGYVDRQDDIFNTAGVLHQGKLAGKYHKHYLPNYGVFDEDRYFQVGESLPVFKFRDTMIGVNICEDIWYPGGPTHDQSLYGNAEIIINISASPYVAGKAKNRFKMMSVRAEDNEVIVAYVNLLGGQDELVFDGNSFIISEVGELIAHAPAFEEALVVADLHPDNVFNRRLHDPRRRKDKLLSIPESPIELFELETRETAPKKRKPVQPVKAPFLEMIPEVYEALKLGLRDYVHKNRFQKVLIGISGGIDSALVATIATDALGKDNVVGVAMPSEFTSEASKTDARQLAENLGITFYEVPITRLYHTYLEELKPFFKDLPMDITEENIQARIRGNLLMAFSNKFGWLVLATGNKSEISVGYCTLYGDMVGGFSVIKDVPKTMVYQLARYRNQLGETPVIPESILKKAPSAELRPDQKDTDSLPPYEVLDPIIEAYVVKDLSYEEILSQGYDPQVVRRVIRMIDGNEYKRRQGAPGIKITYRAFGKDRRFPITNRYNPYEEYQNNKKK